MTRRMRTATTTSTTGRARGSSSSSRGAGKGRAGRRCLRAARGRCSMPTRHRSLGGRRLGCRATAVRRAPRGAGAGRAGRAQAGQRGVGGVRDLRGRAWRWRAGGRRWRSRVKAAAQQQEAIRRWRSLGWVSGWGVGAREWVLGMGWMVLSHLQVVRASSAIACPARRCSGQSFFSHASASASVIGISRRSPLFPVRPQKTMTVRVEAAQGASARSRSTRGLWGGSSCETFC